MSAERPILFSGAMIRAILDGRKTQTRRIVKIGGWLAKHEVRIDCAWPDPGLGDGGYLKVPHRHPHVPPTDEIQSWPVECVRCPYGQPGDRLWVRETFTRIRGNGVRLWYRADGEPRNEQGIIPTSPGEPRWCPSIHMARRESRITLEITGVRVERLQSISEGDARAEGVELGGRTGTENEPGYVGTYRYSFQRLWDQINGKRCPWSSNAWVWVICFRRVDIARCDERAHAAEAV